MSDTTLTVTQLENAPQLKRCLKCGRSLPLTEFYKNNQREDGLTGNCRECITILRKKWDRKYNRSEKARQTAKRYYYSEKGQATKSAYRKSYKLTEEQKERYRLAARKHEKEPRYKARTIRYWQSAKGKAVKAKKDRRYAITPGGKFSKHKTEIKRKHQIKTSDCTLTRKQWQEIKEAHNHTCAYCGRKMERLEMDHIIPLSKGGIHTAANIVPACRTCNAKKGNKLVTPAQFGT